MGKLHTLRRAIIRNPEDWFKLRKNWLRSKKSNKDFEFEWIDAHGAGKNKDGYWPNKHSLKYRGFVKSVLKELGYTDLL